jgi:hypothetical protein
MKNEKRRECIVCDYVTLSSYQLRCHIESTGHTGLGLTKIYAREVLAAVYRRAAEDAAAAAICRDARLHLLGGKLQMRRS